MAAGSDNNDEGNFDDYVITTADPGSYVIVGTFVFCVFLYLLLPCVVSACNRRDRRKRNQSAFFAATATAAAAAAEAANSRDHHDGGGAADGDDNSQKKKKKKGDPLAHQSGAVAAIDLNNDAKGAKLANDGVDDASAKGGGDDDARSVVSSRSSIGSFLSITMDSCGPHNGTRSRRRKRNDIERRLRMLEQQQEQQAGGQDDDAVDGGEQDNSASITKEKTTSSSPSLGDTDDVGDDNDNLSRLDSGSRHGSNISSSVVSTAGNNNKLVPCRTQDTRDEEEGTEGLFSGTRGTTHGSSSGSRRSSSWWVRSPAGRALDLLLEIANWDLETKKLIKLGFPFVTQAIVVGAAEIANVAIVGQFIGTRELAAYVIVDLFLGLTADTLGGLQESLVTLCSQAIGVGNHHLAGQYVQMSVILYTLLFIPTIVIWIVSTEPLLLALGYDEETALIGKEFTVTYIWSLMFYGVSEGIQNVLDVIGYEDFCTVFVALKELLTTAVLLVVAILSHPPLSTVGIIFTVADVLSVIVAAAYIAYKGWFAPYLGGMFRSFSFSNKKAFYLFLKTSAALSFGYILTYGEWEILTVFASFLGPAEVAAWGILGAVWEPLEEITLAVGDAAEVRCAYLLGNGKPEKAKMSSYKSLFLGFGFSLLITSGIYIASDDLAKLLTKDRTLQRLVADLIPLFGLGNVVLTMGSLAWTLIGAQGRYRLATAVGFAGSWLVTTPLAAVMSIALRVNLQGQTAALVAGYMFSGTIQSFLLFRSDWEKLSDAVIEQNNAQNEVEAAVEEPDDNASSSSSGSSSSSSDTKNVDA